MKLHELKPKFKKSPKRVGRGISAGGGKTAGRGTKGQKSRAGKKIPPGFEGGQMPQKLRLPKKKGFYRFPKIITEIVNLGKLEEKFEKGEKVTPETLAQKGLIKSAQNRIKILADGNLEKNLEFERLVFSTRAKEKIIKKAGKIE